MDINKIKQIVRDRNYAPIHTKYNDKNKIEYKYLICDCCGEKIKIENKWEKQTGGVVKVKLKDSIFKIELALHNKCLKEVLKAIEESGKD